jgi:tetratricopeptide (TPR) repeat protein
MMRQIRPLLASAAAVLLPALLLLAPAALCAQAAGHAHADPADTVPRLGEIDFPTSASPAAHAAFVRGVLLLHNFHYGPAAAAFRQAQQLEPGDVMSYWGEAMTYTHPVWNEQDTAAARAALVRLAPTREARLAKARTPRERAWLESAEILYGGNTSKAARDTAYSAAMGRMHAQQPGDVEAASFYALSLLGLNQGDRDVPTYERASLLADSLFRLHPRHPGAAHYLIHAVDDPAHARLGLDAARAYSGIAPSAGHALHMTSHIFVAMGMWADVVRANEEAMATAKRAVGHSAQWIVYGLLQQGRRRKAARWLDSMGVEANSPAERVRGDSRMHLGLTVPAYIADTHQGDAPVLRLLSDTLTVPGAWSVYPDVGRALAAIERRDRAAADSFVARIAAYRAANARREGASSMLGNAEVMEKTLRALLLRGEGEADEAVALLRDAAAQEAALPMDFGPPATIKPPRELAGEMLLEMGKPADARAEFLLALARTPGRSAVLLGLARAETALGNRDEAARRYNQLAANWYRADPDWPALHEARAGGAGAHASTRIHVTF